MAEIVNLFEVDINTDQAVKDATEAKKAIDGLKRAIKELEDAEGDNTEAIAQATSSLKNEQEALRNNTKLTQQAIKAKNAQEGSIEELRAQLAITSIQWAKLSKEERINSDRGKQLTKQKTLLTEQLKKEEAATGDARRNVGNYSRGIQDALGSVTSFVPGLGQAGQAVKQFGFAIQLGLGPITLIVGAIALVVAALKSFFTSSEEGQDALKRLSAVFNVVVGNIVDLLSELGKRLLEPKKALQDLRDFFDETFNKIILGAVEGAFARIGKGISVLALAWEKLKNTFTDNAEGIVEAQERVERANKAIEESNNKVKEGIDNTVKAYNDIKEASKEFIKEQEREIEIAQKLADQQAALDKQIRRTSVQNAKDQAAIAELRVKAADKENETAADRIAFLEEAERLENETLARNEDILAQKLEIRRVQNSLSNSTKEDLEEEARLEVELINLRTQNANARRRLLSELAKARREVRKEQEADEIAELAREAEIADAELQLEVDKAARSAEIEQERLNKINEARELDYQNRLELQQGELFAELEAERMFLESKRLQEIEFAEKIGADVNLINQKYQKANKALDQAEFNAKLALAGDFANNIAQIAGENTAVGKAAAVASTTINTYQAATGAYASLAPIPIVGPALGIAAAGAAIVSGIANVKKILSTKSGLPGDTVSGGGGISASTPSTPPTSLRANVADDVNAGIISRQTSNIGTDDSINVQPTLVTDEVTVSQNQEAANNETSVI